MKPVIGLAGGIGSGKSSVARILESLGAGVIDSDALSHEQLGDPAVMATLWTWWGDAVFRASCEVDRQAIAGIVFQNAAELDRLQRLLYPGIERRRLELTAIYTADPRVRAIVLDSPKLFEVGLNEHCDAVVFVEADHSRRVQRMREARGWSETDVARREKLLIPLDTKRALADYVVVNHSGMAQLRLDIERVLADILATCS